MNIDRSIASFIVAVSYWQQVRLLHGAVELSERGFRRNLARRRGAQRGREFNQRVVREDQRGICPERIQVGRSVHVQE